MKMGPPMQNPSQSAAWLKPACDWATFGKIGGSRQSSVEIALRWPENRAYSSLRTADLLYSGFTVPASKKAGGRLTTATFRTTAGDRSAAVRRGSPDAHLLVGATMRLRSGRPVRAPQSPPHADPGPAVALVREVRRLVRGDSSDGWCVGSAAGRGRCCW
jgi:hypothetical protein